MAIKKYISSKDNTISSAFKSNLSDRATKSNMGSSDVLEIHSIYAQAHSSSLEKTRIIIKFPVDEIEKDRSAGTIPSSGSVTFKLRIFNAVHAQTTPEKYYISAFPLVRDWDEGYGLDMEGFLDLDSSNWISASNDSPWYATGSDYADPKTVVTSSAPLEYKQYLENGTENLDIDITSLVEEWIKTEKKSYSYSTSSFIFPPFIGSNAGFPAGSLIKLYAHDGQHKTFEFTTSKTGFSGNTVYVPTGSSVSALIENLYSNVTTFFGNKFSGSLRTFGTGGPAGYGRMTLTASAPSFYGNRIVSSSLPATDSADNAITIPTRFAGATAATNHGLLIKLSQNYENGTMKKSFYTKKFFARGSQYFFKRPCIEARWDEGIKDDRGIIQKSSSLAPKTENLNSIFLYNRWGSGLADIPNTASNLVVALFSTLANNSTPEVLWQNQRYVTASRVSTGVYKAQFAYTGNSKYLYDVWYASTNAPVSTRESLMTGSGFAVSPGGASFYYKNSQYAAKIINLKPSYSRAEKATFRIHTRNKDWQPNIYNKASAKAPVSIIRDGYFKLSRVADNLTIIPYSTSSAPNYSSLSYDISGSFFNLDMSVLEKNYLYEISLLYKDGSEYVEQKEKFRFRVEV
jgi:hypothetical protein